MAKLKSYCALIAKKLPVPPLFGPGIFVGRLACALRPIDGPPDAVVHGVGRHHLVVSGGEPELAPLVEERVRFDRVHVHATVSRRGVAAIVVGGTDYAITQWHQRVIGSQHRALVGARRVREVQLQLVLAAVVEASVTVLHERGNAGLVPTRVVAAHEELGDAGHCK
ncbi:MAG: hypothetical protein QM756_26770 [Polyangiaceae bacterium]